MTRAEIRTRILRALNDDPTTPVFWTLDEVNALIQEGMEFLAETTQALKRTFYVPLRAGVAVYHLAGCGDDIVSPYRIWLPELKRRLDAWSLTDLDARQETWMLTTGDPWIWYPIDWQQFGVWPVPATGGGILELNTVVWPAALQDDRETPEFVPADHEALVLFGEMEGYLKQYDVGRAADLAQQFAQRWGQAQDRKSVKQLLGAFHVRERHGHGVSSGE